MTELSRRRSPASGSAGGFTLLEVLIATAVLGVAVVALMGLHARNVALVAETADLTVAGALASDVLAAATTAETLEDGLARGRFSPDPDDEDDDTVYGGDGSERFVWMREVLPTALPRLRQIRVAVALAGREDDGPLVELWAARSDR